VAILWCLKLKTPFNSLKLLNIKKPNCGSWARGASAATRTARPELDCHDATTSDRGARQKTVEMPVLQKSNAQKSATQESMTQ
jgi:hypothetical protein